MFSVYSGCGKLNRQAVVGNGHGFARQTNTPEKEYLTSAGMGPEGHYFNPV
jgi:hypothetical protein